MRDIHDVAYHLERAQDALESLSCDCDRVESVDGSYAEEIVNEKLQRLRLGAYDEGLDGTLFEILERIERSLK